MGAFKHKRWPGSLTRLSDDELRRKLLAHSTPTDDGSGCRIWTGGKNGRQYGKMSVGGYKEQTVHRVALELKLGRPITPGLDSCHSCHNRLCITEDHLREDTRKSNLQDAVRADRTAFGVRQRCAKMTPEKVVEIRRDQRSYSTIGAEYGLAIATVFEIKHRKTWARVP